ncbi:hypothetical protein [Mucilaginibacter galii]|nr:hypothetical protein [Mucilaginibacter galii]
MNPKPTYIRIALGVILMQSLFSCKTEQAVIPQAQIEQSVQMVELKNYFAKTAGVNVNLIQYNDAKEEFSINNTAKVSKVTLIKFYDLSKAYPNVPYTKSTYEK